MLNLPTVRKVIWHMTRGLKARIDNAIQRAVVLRVNDALQGQQVQLDLGAGVVVDLVEHFQPYGLSAHPVRGAEALCLSIGGRSDNPAAVGVMDRRFRPRDMHEGEVALHSDKAVGVFIDEHGVTHLGSRDAAEAVAVARRVKEELEALSTYLDSHTHTYSDQGTPTLSSGPESAPGVADPAPSPGSVAARSVLAPGSS